MQVLIRVLLENATVLRVFVDLEVALVLLLSRLDLVLVGRSLFRRCFLVGRPLWLGIVRVFMVLHLFNGRIHLLLGFLLHDLELLNKLDFKLDQT